MGLGILRLTSLLGLTLAIAACSKQEQPAQQVPASAEQAPQFQLTASIQDLMDSVVDPSADYIWDSVGTIITKEGIDERQPRTEEEWKEVRRKAVVLVEATNLLKMKGRVVSHVYIPSEGPGVYDSKEIQQQFDQNHDAFVGFATSLHEVALQMLQAIDAKNVQGMMDTGETLDEVCEACHVTFWYPNEVIPDQQGAVDAALRAKQTAAAKKKK